MTQQSTPDYHFYGFRLRSELPLSLVPPCSTHEPAAEVHLQFGSVPEEFPETIWASPFLSIAPDGSALIQAPEGIRFLVQAGRKITVAALEETDASAIETFLMGAVAGVILHQRGAFPLHASCVEIDDLAVLFAGPCGRGKSTLAKAFLQRGARLLSDDISVIEFRRDVPYVLPGSCGIRLWPDSREMLAAEEETWRPVRSGHRKHVTTSYTNHQDARPLGAIVRLVSNPTASGIRRLQGPSAVMPLSDLVYRTSLGRSLGHGAELFQKAMKLAVQTPIFELSRPDSLERLDEVTGWVIGALNGASWTAAHALAG